MQDPDITVGSSTRNYSNKLEVRATFSICDEWFVVDRYLHEGAIDDPQALAEFSRELLAGALAQAAERFGRDIQDQIKANVEAYRRVHREPVE